MYVTDRWSIIRYHWVIYIPDAYILSILSRLYVALSICLVVCLSLRPSACMNEEILVIIRVNYFKFDIKDPVVLRQISNFGCHIFIP